jgi:hypothetical protein
VGDTVGVALGELQHVQDDRARHDQAEQDLGQAAGGVPVDGRSGDPGEADAEDGHAPAGAEYPVDLLEDRGGPFGLRDGFAGELQKTSAMWRIQGRGKVCQASKENYP